MHSALRFVAILPLALLTVCAQATQSPEPKPAAQGKPEASAFDPSHKLWTEVLAAHVHGDGFDYKKLKSDRAKLDQYVAALEAVKPDEYFKWSKKEQFAFWIDVYNAYTIRLVVDAYPIDSIKDLGSVLKSVWDRELVPLGPLAPELKRAKLTLNDVENQILRPVFKDARVHAAINCASQGCPPLRAEAFRGADLDKQLDDQVTRWLHDDKRNRFDESKHKLVVSKIFDWFKDDFARDAQSVPAWIARYVPEHKAWLTDPKTKIDIEYVDYSWKLNEAK
jgi:hypothetical protein